jgi:hypothetical protein
MDKAKAEEEKIKILNKLFRCAESPIKEWVAEVFDLENAFPDYTDDSDVIGFEYNQVYYNAYLVSLRPNLTGLVDEKILNNSNDAKKACSMLFDAMRIVFPSVVQTCDEPYLTKFKGLSVSYTNMAFQLCRRSMSEAKLNVIYAQLAELYKLRETADDKDKINDLIEKLNTDVSLITNEMLEEELDNCAKENESLSKKNWMYLVIEPAVADIDLSMERLVSVGMTYQDPDEKTLIDKLKDELAD